MGTRMNKQTYAKLIEENIAEMEKYMPEHSLEKQHAIDVLKWSINAHYEMGDELELIKRDNERLKLQWEEKCCTVANLADELESDKKVIEIQARIYHEQVAEISELKSKLSLQPVTIGKEDLRKEFEILKRIESIRGSTYCGHEKQFIKSYFNNVKKERICLSLSNQPVNPPKTN